MKKIISSRSALVACIYACVVLKLRKTKLFGEVITLESGVEDENLLEEFREALAAARKLAEM